MVSISSIASRFKHILLPCFYRTENINETENNMAASVDADAYTKPFQLTASVRRDVYPAVDPANSPELESSSKVVIVTGASGGLGSVSIQNPPKYLTQMSFS